MRQVKPRFPRRETARAVTDALQLLQRAKRVMVLSVDGRTTPGGHGEQPGADIALYLSRHGVKAEAARPERSRSR
ncbi:MAG: hypothetical protein O3A91_09005 [Proteobacteria bacterium]|nr:hypothetical protein [Pseudomonadota bacterium]